MIIIGIDPSMKATGICAWDLDLGPTAVEVVRLSRAGHTQADSIAVLRRLVGDAEWAVALEQPPPVKRGFRNAPSAAHQHWKDAIDLLAREQAAERGVRYRKPDVRHPLPHQWRKPLGLPTRGGRDHLKARAIAYVREALAPRYLFLSLGNTERGDDEAEAICIASWLASLIGWERRMEAGAERWGVPKDLRPKKTLAKPTTRPRRTKGAA